MPWEPRREAVICISTRLLSKEASFPLQAAWLQESFREDAIPIEGKPTGWQVRITYSNLHESFLFECGGSLVKKKKKKRRERVCPLPKAPTYIKLFLTLFILRERISLFSHCGVVLYNTGFHRRWSYEKRIGSQKNWKEMSFTSKTAMSSIFELSNKLLIWQQKTFTVQR